MFKLLTRILVILSLSLAAGCGSGTASETDADVISIDCCVSRKLCGGCFCSDVEEQTAANGTDPNACAEQFVPYGGCGNISWGQAVQECKAMNPGGVCLNCDQITDPRDD